MEHIIDYLPPIGTGQRKGKTTIVEAATAATVQVEEAQGLDAIIAGRGSHSNQTMVALDAVRVRKTFGRWSDRHSSRHGPRGQAVLLHDLPGHRYSPYNPRPKARAGP